MLSARYRWRKIASTRRKMSKLQFLTIEDLRGQTQAANPASLFVEEDSDQFDKRVIVHEECLKQEND